MKKTILNALWAKIKSTFVEDNSDAILHSINVGNVSGVSMGTGRIAAMDIMVENTLINSNGINVKSGAVVLNSSGINVRSGVTIHSGGINIGSGYINGNNLYIGSGYISATGNYFSNFSSISVSNGITVSSGIDVGSGAVNISGSGINIKSGVIISSGGITIPNSSGYISAQGNITAGSLYIHSTGTITATGGTSYFNNINCQNGIDVSSGSIDLRGYSGNINITGYGGSVNLSGYGGSVNLKGSYGGINFENSYLKIKGYTGATGTGRTTMSNIVIDSSNDIEFLNFQKISYLNLLSLKESNQLIRGKSYIIMDYEASINSLKNYLDVDTTYNKFNIIVTADTIGQLSEDAILTASNDPNLFPGVDLDAFNKYISKIKVKYCIDNDIRRFDWADTATGKGVIYRMIDQYGNDMPFDFIHMKFKRYVYNRSDSSLKSQKWTPDIPNLPVGLPRIENCLPEEFSNGVNTYLENFAGGTGWSDLENEVFCMHTSAGSLYVLQNPDGINLLVPNAYLKHYESGDNYLHNEHPANNIISPRYVTTIIDNHEYRTMSIPNITVMSDSANNYIKISNNYFGPNADEISIFGSHIENNKFDGNINNVFFAGHYTTNVNITKNAHIENTILMSLENVDIGGNLYNTWFCYPILNGSINGEIYDSLIFFDGDSGDALSLINIEKNVFIRNSILKLPSLSDELMRTTLRELYIFNSAIGYDSKTTIDYFNVKLLDGRIKNKAFDFGGAPALQDDIGFMYLHAFNTDIYIMNSIGDEMSQPIMQVDYWNS